MLTVICGFANEMKSHAAPYEEEMRREIKELQI